MKNTASIPVTDGVTVLPKSGFISRWGALPFLGTIALSGMPLQRSLEVAQPIWLADVYASSLAATSESSSLQSIPVVLLYAAIYLFAGFMLLGKPKTAFSVVQRQWPLLLLMLFVAVTMLWSPSKGKGLFTLVNNLGAMLITVSAALQYRSTPWLLPKHLGYVLGFNIVVHLASILLLPSYTIDWDGRWRGLVDQPNGLGAIAFCAFWANAAVLVGTKQDKYHLHLALAGFALAAMLGANSMTSILSSIFALAMLYLLARTGSRNRTGERLFIGGIGLLLLVAAVGVMYLTNALDLGKLLGLAGRSSDFTGRTEIWILAIKAISAQPWFGWGFDGNNFLIKTTGMNYTTYHNGYLDLMVHGGATALGLFFLLLANWLPQLMKRTRMGSVIIPFAVPFVVSMLVYNLTEATLVGPRNHIWLVFLVILFLSGCRKWPQMAPTAGSNAPIASVRKRTRFSGLFPSRPAMTPSNYMKRVREPDYPSSSGETVTRSMAESSPPTRRVVIVERRLLHYRVAFYNRLRALLEKEGIKLELLFGDGTRTEIQKMDAASLNWATHIPNHYIFGSRFCWQPFGSYALGADLVIVGQQNKLLYNLWLLSFGRPKRIAFWGHGRNMQSNEPNGVKERFKRWTVNKVDWWFAYTEMSAALVTNTGFPPDRITVFENAVDTNAMAILCQQVNGADRQRIRAQLGLGDGPIGIYIGSLYLEKRLDFLLDAARQIQEKLPSFQLLVVGAGPELALIEAAAKQYDWIHYLGPLQNQKKAEMLVVSDVMLNPGLVGLGILDSFVSGTPMFTTDCRLHSPEISYLTSGENGVMTPNDVNAYASAVIAALSEPETINKLKKGALSSASRYTIENMADRCFTGIVACLSSA